MPLSRSSTSCVSQRRQRSCRTAVLSAPPAADRCSTDTTLVAHVTLGLVINPTASIVRQAQLNRLNLNSSQGLNHQLPFVGGQQSLRSRLTGGVQ